MKILILSAILIIFSPYAMAQSNGYASPSGGYADQHTEILEQQRIIIEQQRQIQEQLQQLQDMQQGYQDGTGPNANCRIDGSAVYQQVCENTRNRYSQNYFQQIPPSAPRQFNSVPFNGEGLTPP